MTTTTMGNGISLKGLLIFVIGALLFIVIMFMVASTNIFTTPSNQPEILNSFHIQYGGKMDIQPVLLEASATNATELRIIQLVNGHAWLNHGTEVNTAFKCLGDGGNKRSFKTFGFKDSFGNPIPTNLWLCQDKNDGKWYAIVTTAFEKIGNNVVARLITAYAVSADLFPKIDDFISYIILKWNAREIQYLIGAENIVLEPIKP